jgi:hypothetical protein
MKTALTTFGLTLVLASSAVSQDVGTIVLTIGTPIPNHGNITNVFNMDVDREGRWACVVDTDFPFSKDLALVTSEGFTLGESHEVPGYPGSVVTQIIEVDRDGNGNFYTLIQANLTGAGNHTERLILRNTGTTFLTTDDVLPTGHPDWSDGTVLQSIFAMWINEGGDILLATDINDPLVAGDNEHALLKLSVDAAGAITAWEAIIEEGDVPAGQTGALNALAGFEDSCVLGDNGHVMWSADMTGDQTFDNVAYLGGTLIGQERMPSPEPGRNWDSPFFPSMDINKSGEWVLRDDLEDIIPNIDDGLIVKNGQVYRRENTPIPGFSQVILLIGSTVQIIDDGRVLHWLRLTPGGGLGIQEDEFLMLDDQILMREGHSTVDGLVVDSIHVSRNEYDIDSAGNWVLTEVRLSGGLEVLALSDLSGGGCLGTSYCSAELNSTGAPSVTCATGSPVVADGNFTLTTPALPTNQFGYYLASLTQGDVLFPGGSQGRLCVGGTIARFTSQLQNSGAAGEISIAVDLNAIPMSPPVAVQPGQTWNFQLWFRDNNPGPTSNFSLPVSVLFQ